MKYLYLLTISFSLFSIQQTDAQNCLPADITLLTQSDVDNFQTTYGACDTITGTLQIGNYSTQTTDITTLAPLSHLKSVWSLIIVDNDNLTSLNGLHNIVKDGVSKLIVSRNLILTDISQLSGFGPTGGDVAVAENPALTSLLGLQSLRTLGTAINVRDNPLITNLHPLSGITRVDGFIAIQNNSTLTDISGLSNIVTFGGGANPKFTLKDNILLQDCTPICDLIHQLPFVNNLTIDIQGNLAGCLDYPTIVDSCLMTNHGIYDGSGTVPTNTAVSLEETLEFDTTTLVIDGLNNRVGIGTNTPTASLEVDGTVKLSGLPSSGTLSKVIAVDANGNAFEFDISLYDSDTSDDFDGAFGSLTGVPAGLADGDDNTQLSDIDISTFGYIKSANDADSDPTNEIQDLSPYQTIAGAASWDQNASDDFDGAFSSLTGVPVGLADGDDNTQLSDSDISTLGYIKSANDADSDPTNELYDDSDVIDSIASLRSDITALESQGPGSSLYNSDGSITGNRAITLGTSDINFDANTFVIDGSDNKIGIGTSTPTYELDVIGDVGISGAIYGLSDERIKKNRAPITDALSILSQLKPVTYKFDQKKYAHLNLSEEKQYGLIAQELEKVLPELVSSMHHTEDGEELKSVNYDGLIALLVAVLQEQQNQINKLIAKSKHHQDSCFK